MASITNQREQWSDLKKEWCCKHQGVSCGTRLGLFTKIEKKDKDDEDGHHDDKDGHHDQRKVHSTSYQYDVDLQTDHDCLKSVEQFELAWADSKKAYCCKKKGIGCQVKLHKGHRVWFAAKYEQEEHILEGVGHIMSFKPAQWFVSIAEKIGNARLPALP